jgi:hypothetical protein
MIHLNLIPCRRFLTVAIDDTLPCGRLYELIPPLRLLLATVAGFLPVSYGAENKSFVNLEQSENEAS